MLLVVIDGASGILVDHKKNYKKNSFRYKKNVFGAPYLNKVGLVGQQYLVFFLKLFVVFFLHKGNSVYNTRRLSISSHT